MRRESRPASTTRPSINFSAGSSCNSMIAGLEVFAVIDHSGEAREAGLLMADTKLVVFGNPATVTPLMLAHPLLALDLSLKILIWETTDQHAFVSYNTPRALAERYELPPDQAEALELVEVIAQSLSPPD